MLKAIVALATNHKFFDDDELRIFQTYEYLDYCTWLLLWLIDCFHRIALEIVEQGYVASLAQASRHDLVTILATLLDKYPTSRVILPLSPNV